MLFDKIWYSDSKLPVLVEMFIVCQKSWEVIENVGFHSVNMTWRPIIVLRFLLEMFIFCQKSWWVVENVGFLSVNMTWRSIIVFAIFTRNVRVMPEILGSGWKCGILFRKYDMTINYRVWDFCSECSFSARNFEEWSNAAAAGRRLFSCSWYSNPFNS